MKTYFIIILILITTLYSCKNDSKKQQLENNNTQIEPIKNFKITLNTIVKKDDNFQIYFTEKTSSDFNEDESVWVEIKGSEVPQDIIFDIPADVLPTVFRIDFGLNKNQKVMKLNSVTVEYLNKKFECKGLEIANYFRPIGNTKIDFSTGFINPILEKGLGVEPVLYPQEVPLEIEMKKLY